jgi:hypothetical protein
VQRPLTSNYPQAGIAPISSAANAVFAEAGTRAMAAGLSDHIWTRGEIAALLA